MRATSTAVYAGRVVALRACAGLDELLARLPLPPRFTSSVPETKDFCTWPASALKPERNGNRGLDVAAIETESMDQGGTSFRDEVYSVSAGLNGSYTMAGYTVGEWNKTNGGSKDWMAAKLNADGTLQWKWQGGTDGWEKIKAVTTGSDGSVVMVGNSGNGTLSFAAVKLDEDGGLLWKWQELHRSGTFDSKTCNPYRGMTQICEITPSPVWGAPSTQEGSTAGDSADAVDMTEDGSVIMAGSTFGLWGEDHFGSSDFIASKLDSDGTLIWAWQNGTEEAEEINAAVVGDDDTVVLAGHTFGNWTEAQAGDGDADFAAVKLDADGNELWRWQDGTTATDWFYGAAIGQDGSVVLAGLTEGSWTGVHAGGVNDFAAVKLDADGIEIWRWQDGTTEDDVIKGVAPGDDGSVVLAGYTKGAWSGSSDGSYDFAAVKLDASGAEVWRWQGGSATSASEKAEAVAVGPNGLFVLAGNTAGSWAEENAGVYDMVAVMLGTDAAATPSPSTGLLSGVGGSSSTLAPTSIRATPSPATGLSPIAPAIAAPSSPAPSNIRTNTFAPSTSVRSIDVATSSAPASSAPASLAPATTWPISPVRPPLPAPASLAPAAMGPTSPAPVSAGVGTKSTSTPELSPYAPTPFNSESTSSSGGPSSTALIAVASVAAAAAAIIVCVCFRKKHRGKQKQATKRVGAVPATVVGLSGETASSDAPPVAGDSPTISGGYDVFYAVVGAANHLAQHSQFPGVSEAAMLVSTLVNLISEDQGSVAEIDARLKRCRLMITMLQRAATVLGKIDSIQDTDSSRGMKRMLVENVQDAIGDMVGLIKTYRSKRRITQVVVSTLFNRRMEATEEVINQAFEDLMRWLHIDAVLHHQESFRSLTNGRSDPNAAVGPSLARQKSEAEVIASARLLRRQSNLEQIEIPEDHVLISEDILGKGGFGTVYIADYNGRNAAAKVIEIDLAHREREGKEGDDDRAKQAKVEASRQRAALLMELQAMIHLRSPHTVNVYGAITSRKDRIVLVMELLTGGDLRSLLRYSEEQLNDARRRTIIGDVCAGMAFLHSKNTIHGDLKSANVLLDGEGRAKIGDFGTSRLAQHRDSTGLATYKPTKGSTANLMSFAWAAPEVLDMKGSSFASDVYSFGVVAWEVLSMQVPWAEEVSSLDIYKRVVFKGERPEMPADAPADIAGIVRSCWAGAPEERPTASEVLGTLK